MNTELPCQYHTDRGMLRGHVEYNLNLLKVYIITEILNNHVNILLIEACYRGHVEYNLNLLKVYLIMEMLHINT